MVNKKRAKGKLKAIANIDVNRGPDRRAGQRRANDFWLKVENAFGKFGKTSKLI